MAASTVISHPKFFASIKAAEFSYTWWYAFSLGCNKRECKRFVLESAHPTSFPGSSPSWTAYLPRGVPNLVSRAFPFTHPKGKALGTRVRGAEQERTQGHLQSTPFIVNIVGTSSLVSSLVRIPNSGSLFQSNVFKLFLTGINLLSVLSQRCQPLAGVIGSCPWRSKIWRLSFF